MTARSPARSRLPPAEPLGEGALAGANDGAPDEAPAYDRPSKTQRKKEMTALQDLGTRLTRLNSEQLQRLPLPERLREAIDAARRITAHEARRRQMQYIGKLMRQVEAEPIERALDDLTGDSRAAVALMHRCERWRDRLLDDDKALTELLRELPPAHGTDVAAEAGAETQALRAMIRAARRERDGSLPPKHARELYRWLHERLRPAQGESTAAAATDRDD